MDRFQFVPVAQVPESAWDQLVHDSPEGWLYQTRAWANWAAKWIGESRSFAAFSPENELVGVFPLYRQDLVARGFLRLRRFGTHLSGPVLSARLTPKSHRLLLKAMFRHVDQMAEAERIDILQVQLTTLAPAFLRPNRPDINPLFYVGCTSPLTLGTRAGAVQPLTRIIYLDRPEQELLMDMDSDCRAAVRQAERKGVTLVEDDSVKGLRTFARLQEQSWQRTGLEPHPLEYYEEMWHALRPGTTLKLFFAMHEGRTVAAVMVHAFKTGAYYWGGCSDGSALALRPNNYLLWNAIRWARNQGLGFFEVGQFFPHPTGDPKEYNVGKFKTQFGKDELVPFAGQKVYRTRFFVTLGILRGLKAAISGLAALLSLSKYRRAQQ